MELIISDYFRQQSAEFGMPPKTPRKARMGWRSGEWVLAPRLALDLEDAAGAQDGGEGRGQPAGGWWQEGERGSIEPSGGGAIEQEEEKKRVGERREVRRNRTSGRGRVGGAGQAVGTGQTQSEQEE